MEENEQALDQNLIQAETEDPEMNLAGSGKRLANFLIDMVCYYFLGFLIAVVIGAIGDPDVLDNKGVDYLLIFGTMFIYFTFFETLFGKTVGKMITRSHVVDTEGQKLTFSKAAGRSVCRFIPFDAFSFLGSNSIGWHDRMSGTRVVNDNRA